MKLVTSLMDGILPLPSRTKLLCGPRSGEPTTPDHAAIDVVDAILESVPRLEPCELSFGFTADSLGASARHAA